MRAHAGPRAPSTPGVPSSSLLHTRPFGDRAQPRSVPGSDAQTAVRSPATHDLASISIHAPIQRESWWKKARGAGNYLWDTARDSGAVAKTLVSGGLAAAGTAMGALAVGGAAAVTGSLLAPAAAVGAGAYLGYRGLDWAMSPRAPQEEERLRLPREGLTERPDKTARSLKGKDELGQDLTAHHKIPFNRIRDTVNDATGNSWGSLVPGRQARARANLAIWGARGGAEEVGPRALTWTPHNLFLGPAPENRPDDPEEALDTHFTPSGTVTPRSELALDVTHAGGLSRMDHTVLRRRLHALAAERSNPSAYDQHDWQGAPNARTQRGQPAGWENLSTAQRVQAVAARKKAKQQQRKNKKKRT